MRLPILIYTHSTAPAISRMEIKRLWMQAVSYSEAAVCEILTGFMELLHTQGNNLSDFEKQIDMTLKLCLTLLKQDPRKVKLRL